MSVISVPDTDVREPRFVLHGVGWPQYVTIAEALPDQPGLKVVFNDGRSTLMSPSRRHGWYAERIGDLVVAVAGGLGIEWEDAAHATYRLEGARAGVEGDKTFYLGANAEVMRGPLNVDLTTQPPPDLAIEVEVTHSADDAVEAWGRLGTPEVWRFDTERATLRFLARLDDGSYALSPRSLAFPALEPEDILRKLRDAEESGSSRWFARLPDWVRDVLLPRRGE